MKRTHCIPAVVALFTMIISGCAMTPNVGYERSANPQASPKRASVYFESFADARTSAEKGILGGMYNGYNMRMGNVVEPPNMIDSLKSTYRSELRAAGYELIENQSDLVMNCALISITCDTRMSSEATISLDVKLTDRGEEVFSKTYTGKASVFKIIGADPSGALNKSIQKVAEQIIKDLDEYITT